MSDESNPAPQGERDQEWRELGPCLNEKGVTYRMWALGRKKFVVEIEGATGKKRSLELAPGAEPGYFSGNDPEGKAGDLYKYVIDDAAAVPDFLSHYQPRGVMGPSMVMDSTKYAWKCKGWQRPPWRGHVIYECHIGTFSPEGTYLSTVKKLDHLRDLGITAVEFMPIAQSPGTRGWGYDGVMLYAPYHAYGTPDEFRELVDECHLRGLAVILDTVFNHLGPEGNFSHQVSDFFFHQGRDNPWGQNFNLDGENAEPVRTMLRQNIEYWLKEFRVDGFRMDATHMVHDESAVHLLAECAEIAHRYGGYMIAEDDRNSRMLLEPMEKGGWNFDALWSDDYHHVMRVSQTGEQQHFYSMVKGTVDEMVTVLRDGWLYSGQRSEFHQAPRGTLGADLEPEHFVFCISNHDQAGNRLLGDRFHHGIETPNYRALSLFHCLIPYTPLFFMGQEWGSSSPFFYFTDMSEELGILVAEGRRKDFLSSNFARDENELAMMSHPQEIVTFQRSKLDWAELEGEEHQRHLRLHRDALKLRRELFGAGNPPRRDWSVEKSGDGLVIQYRMQGLVSVYLHFYGAAPVVPEGGKMLMRSNAREYSGHDHPGGIETFVIRTT